MQLKFLICIPVFNHPLTVNQVIQDCLSHQEHSILVVDDGSDSDVKSAYESVFPLNSRVHFLKHEKNKGKGAALQTAIKWAVRNGFTHLVTIDADGQHSAHNINDLIKNSYLKPWSVILGDRQMKTENVPKSSVFGKAFSNFWVKYQTDKVVGDSQSGFRIYPLFYLQTMRFLTKRYDFEVEVLTRLIWNDVEVFSVPVEVKYFPAEKRVSHFNKFRDNLHLTILNTILVSVSLLRRKDAPVKSALATAIGVFVGCMPVYGLHTLIVAGLAFLFRMNFIYLWLGTHISLPPLVPFLILGAKYTSTLYLGHSPEGIFGISHDWIVGILIFATGASLVAFVGVYFLKRMLDAPRSTQKISVKSKNGLGIAILQGILKIFGLRATYFCLLFVIPYYFLFSLKARKASSQFWKIVRPNDYFFKRQFSQFKQLYVFAKVLVDRALQKNSEKFYFKIVEGLGVTNFKQKIENKKIGHVVMQSHLGGWEMAMSYFRRFDKKLMAVMYGVEGSYQHTSVNENDQSVIVARFNMQSDTIIKLKGVLEKGELVGLMGDRPVGRSYELVSFFGKLALFDSSAIRLALMCEAQVHLLFCFKLDTERYLIETVNLDLQNDSAFVSLSRDEKIMKALNIYAQNLESYLQKYPEQWFNFFPFWSEKIF